MVTTVFSDEIVNSTDLRNKQKHWLDMAFRSPITVNYGNRKLVIMNREQLKNLYMQKYYMEMVFQHCEAYINKTKSDIFPWTEYLQDNERIQFNNELLACMDECIRTGNWDSMQDLLGDWEATAEVARNPEATKLLLEDIKPKDYVTLK